MFEILICPIASVREHLFNRAGSSAWTVPSTYRNVQAHILAVCPTIHLSKSTQSHRMATANVRENFRSQRRDLTFFPSGEAEYYRRDGKCQPPVAKIFPAANHRGNPLKSAPHCNSVANATGSRHQLFAAVQAPQQISAEGLNPTKAVRSVTGGLCFPKPNLSSGVEFPIRAALIIRQPRARVHARGKKVLSASPCERPL